MTVTSENYLITCFCAPNQIGELPLRLSHRNLHAVPSPEIVLRKVDHLIVYFNIQMGT